MAFITSLDGQTVISLSIYATSSFQKHSALAIVYIVQGIINGTSLSIRLDRVGLAC